jgi:hypothetical protein
MILKEVVVAQLRFHPCICLEGQKEIAINVSQDSGCPVEIRIKYHPHTSSEHYLEENLYGGRKGNICLFGGVTF